MNHEIEQLARDIQQLRIDYERFFNGGLPLPPDELKGRIQAQLRTLRNVNLKAFAENFRLADLEARFNSYSELYNRRLRELEEGRGPVRHAPPEPAGRYDPEKGVVVGEAAEHEAVEALYRGLASGPGDGPRFDLESFRSYVERQAAAIRQKTGCSEVQFRVAAEDGKMKLKARPLGAPRALA